MLDPYLQYQIETLFTGIPMYLVVIIAFIAGVIAWKFRTALAILGAVAVFLFASGYFVILY